VAPGTMKTISESGQAQKLFIYLRSSLWFVPFLIIFGSIAMALGLVEIDKLFEKELRQWSPRFFAIDPEGARSILSAIAGAMATVAGVVFSITVVALTLASSQYTSRVLRNFMRDPVNQVMLGVFIGVYIYCLLVLRTVSGANGGFVPSISILTALAATIFASCFFIFFIHHISSTIQASEMANSITMETLDAVELLCPERGCEDSDVRNELDLAPGLKWYGISASKMGYIQGVDTDALLTFACKHDTIVRMECHIGDFVSQDQPLASLALRQPPDDHIIKSLNEIYAVDTYRTIDQDAAFGIRQLVDMSLKALSPGINDTTTAVTCIEHLSVILNHCARGQIAPKYRYRNNQLRVIVARHDFAYLTSLAFRQILENAEGNSEIVLRLLSAVGRIARATSAGDRVGALHRQVDEIERLSQRTIQSSQSMEEIQATVDATRRLLNERRLQA
jgi:uncharacterized membrane protein